MQKYFIIYRSTPHSVTSISPAELLLKRKLRTKIPSMETISDDFEVRDRDTEN